jgi:hypothetical protein
MKYYNLSIDRARVMLWWGKGLQVLDEKLRDMANKFTYVNDACKMNTWTLSFIILNFQIFATYMMIVPCFTLIYGDLQWSPLFDLWLCRTGKPYFVYFILWETYTESNWPGIFGESLFHREKHPAALEEFRMGLRPKRAHVMRPYI